MGQEEGEEVVGLDNCRYDTGKVESKVQSQTGWVEPLLGVEER